MKKRGQTFADGERERRIFKVHLTAHFPSHKRSRTPLPPPPLPPRPFPVSQKEHDPPSPPPPLPFLLTKATKNSTILLHPLPKSCSSASRAYDSTNALKLDGKLTPYLRKHGELAITVKNCNSLCPHTVMTQVLIPRFPNGPAKKCLGHDNVTHTH
jgi:hypothetical protein